MALQRLSDSIHGLATYLICLYLQSNVLEFHGKEPEENKIAIGIDQCYLFHLATPFVLSFHRGRQDLEWPTTLLGSAGDSRH